ncbi:protein RRP6-like 3 isoform X5 [Populus trichocarpa]|uniref:3'-5' exonuclease domain-containing protein n=1 Tax=Populus trichocarpa TaxID=3694 RepID=A0A3N7EKC0_POPTR|nr:protein RRP6-like 3 isoform X5 [Populus trichocarpa]|eukprot:XP_024451575.1 protein RRP6-like 3 isoform X5 [Populus trichocarpa]
MEYKDKLKIAALTIASLAALSSVIFLVTSSSKHYRRRRRKQQQQQKQSSSCYLQSHQKPQLSFKRVLLDNSFSQFKHLNLHAASSSNFHPYEADIKALIENPESLEDYYSDHQKMSEFFSYVWIETETQLKDLAHTLSKHKVFAVDTEQHSLRSFLGFTALIQISTRNEDYLVDTIALHDVMGVLAPVFADPTICKVFHGADNDVLWLQRDFHIYVVNLFDTAKACEVLSKPQKSLAYLLETYCGVATNKLLQREDWRQRPLSAEMLEYAQTDAHYLLYIAGCLIAELKLQDRDNSNCPNDKLDFVLEARRRSNMICLQLYAKEVEAFPGESAASSIFSRHLNGQRGSSISYETQDLVRCFCTWRDLMARVHDESLRYVLSDQAIVLLAVKVPTTPEEIFDTIAEADLNVENVNLNSSLPSPSPVVCSHLDDLYCLIKDKKSNADEVLLQILQNCLGPNGSCPLSVYNYALLINCDLIMKNRLVSKQSPVINSKQVARKASRELFVQKFSCKSPVYHNCRIYANDGRLLCYCDRRKLEWYLRRDLAKLVDDDALAITLLFEPKGRPEDEGNDFYIQSKKNICVGCGEGSHYLRYRIIPSCYRMHFPEHLKSHRSHDIVLLCVDCHELAHAAAEKYKKQVAKEFGIPLFVRKVVDSKEIPVISESSSSVMNVEETGVSPLHLRTAAMALLRHGQRMPLKRREELTQIVMQYYGGREISEEDLERALLVGMSPHERRRFEKKRRFSSKHSTEVILLDKEQMGAAYTMAVSTTGNSLEKAVTKDGLETTEMESTGHGPHGKQVVDHILEEYGEDGIRQFCQRWRQVFVEAVHPRFLPAGWDVMHSGRRDFGEFSVYNPTNKAPAANT